ncbi:MAG: hypothetical protein WCJ37_09335 [Syntrophus sp. (in: bacteria)]
MIDRSRRKERLNRIDLLKEIKTNDLIALSDGDGVVHIVFPGTKSICRPPMIEVGTLRRDIRTWDIIGCADFESYRKGVAEESNMRPCGHCLMWYK